MITVDSDTFSPLGEPALPGGTSEPGAVASTLTGDPSIDGLIAGHQWDTFSLGYNFPSTASFYASTVAERSGFLAATDPMEAQIRAVLANYNDVCNLTFSELNPSSHDAALHMAMTVQADSLAGTGYFPDDAQHGNLWIDR